MSSVIFLRLRRQEKGSWTKWRDPDRQEASGPADALDASPGTSPRHTSSGSGAVDIAMAATVCGAAVGDTGGDSAEEWQFTHGSDGRTEQMAGCPHRRAIWMRRQPTRQLTRHCPAVDITTRAKTTPAKTAHRARRRGAPMPQRYLVLSILAVVATQVLGRARAVPTGVEKLCAFCSRPPCFWESPSAVADLQAMLASSKAEVLAARDKAKHSAMNIAAYHLNVEGVKALIAAGADASNPDKNGHRPLHHTVLSKQGGARPGDQKAIVEALIAARADPGAKDVSGKTPADICGASKHGCGPAVIAALRSTSNLDA